MSKRYVITTAANAAISDRTSIKQPDPADILLVDLLRPSRRAVQSAQLQACGCFPFGCLYQSLSSLPILPNLYPFTQSLRKHTQGYATKKQDDTQDYEQG